MFCSTRAQPFASRGDPGFLDEENWHGQLATKAGRDVLENDTLS